MKKKIFVTIAAISFLLGFSACKSQKEVFNGTGKGFPIIVLLKTSCFGNQCPAYEMQLLDNRVMLLDARKNMDKSGKYHLVLTKEDFQFVVNAFIDSHFFDFQDEYVADITDLPSMYLTFNFEGKSKKVRDYYGAPESLKELELIVQSYLDRVGWQKVE